MTIQEYQIRIQHELYKPHVVTLQYLALGLCGESGEFADRVKKILRDKGGYYSLDDRELLIEELGDVLWNLTMLATWLDITLDDLAYSNYIKLDSRIGSGIWKGEE